MTTCPFCEQPSHAKACPTLRELLFAPATLCCNSCGDPIDHDGLCPACYEAGEQLNADRAIVTGIVRDAFGISLELRQDIRRTTEAREEYAPF